MATVLNGRIGETWVTNEGYIIVILEYINSGKVLIEFQDEHKTQKWTQYYYCKSGNIHNPFHPTVFEVGYIGVGGASISHNGKQTKCYRTWKSMIARCYDEKYQKVRPTYENCKVCEEWHNFQNFAKWFEENYYEVDNEIMCLDKDILVKGNKVYSPETCVFVPKNINVLFTKTNAKRGAYPIGVSHAKEHGYIAYCQNQLLDKRVHLGTFKTIVEAFNAYKQYKEKHIQDVANHYKAYIPTRLYNSMMKYKVEIVD